MASRDDLLQSLQRLHVQQHQQDADDAPPAQTAISDRSDGRADVEPSTRDLVTTTAGGGREGGGEGVEEDGSVSSPSSANGPGRVMAAAATANMSISALPRRGGIDSPHYEGYGFRPASGTSTPLREGHTAMLLPVSSASPLPDPNGLGWPGASLTHTRSQSRARMFLKPLQSSARSLPPRGFNVVRSCHSYPFLTPHFGLK
jgi:hypothetical protein